MSENTPAETFTDAFDATLANLPWILLLVSVERGFDGHYLQAAGALGGCVLAFVLAIHRRVFDRWTDPMRRKWLALALIVIGASIVAMGVYLLWNQQAPAAMGTGAPAADELARRLDEERAARSSIEAQLTAAKRDLDELSQRARSAAPTPPIAPPKDRRFTDKTIRQLRAIYEGRTGLQAEAFISDEYGKSIEVDGKVVSVFSGMAMLASNENNSDMVECRFSPPWNPKLSTYRIGDMMKVLGVIAPTQNGAQIYLNDCEIRN